MSAIDLFQPAPEGKEGAQDTFPPSRFAQASRESLNRFRSGVVPFGLDLLTSEHGGEVVGRWRPIATKSEGFERFEEYRASDLAGLPADLAAVVRRRLDEGKPDPMLWAAGRT